MPPQVALIACTVFVFFLLRIERKQSGRASWTLWLPTLWILCTASRPPTSWLGGGAAEGTFLDQVFFVGLLCLGLIALFLKRIDWSGALRGNVWIVVLVTYMLVSISWSDIPFTSFKRWVREVTAIIMALLLLTERDPRRAVVSVFKKTVYITIPFSVLVIKYFPLYGVAYAAYSGATSWQGVALQKNGLGRLCVFSIFVLVWTLARRLRERGSPVVKYQLPADVFLLIIAFILLRGPGAYSATAVASLSVGLAMFSYLLWQKRRERYLGPNIMTAMIAFVIILGTVTMLTSASAVGAFTSTLGREDTLTGRTEIWARVLSVAMQHPVFGGGFGGFWTPETRIWVTVNECHNGYLETIVDLGFVGLLLFSMFLITCCRKAQSQMRRDFSWASLWSCFLLMVVVHNIAESSLNTFTSHLMTVLLFLAVVSSDNRLLRPGIPEGIATAHHMPPTVVKKNVDGKRGT